MRPTMTTEPPTSPEDPSEDLSEDPAGSTAVGEALRTVLGSEPDPGLIRDLVAQRWPIGVLTSLRDLAVNALEQQGGYCQRMRLALESQDEEPTHVLGRLLIHDLMQFFAWTRIPADDALRWIEVLAGAPDKDAADTISEALTPQRSFRPRLPEAPALTWNRSLPAALAPLAFAAGLTLDEAVALYADGVLDEPGLRTLAGLRGYHLAP
jgi:hypothetical protein